MLVLIQRFFLYRILTVNILNHICLKIYKIKHSQYSILQHIELEYRIH